MTVSCEITEIASGTTPWECTSDNGIFYEDFFNDSPDDSSDSQGNDSNDSLPGDLIAAVTSGLFVGASFY